MQIADLRIENFRGIRAGHIRFGPHTVFIGPNNCGKTTVIEALALLFGRDRMVRTLTEHDFFGSDPQPADRIRLVATIVEFDDRWVLFCLPLGTLDRPNSACDTSEVRASRFVLRSSTRDGRT